MTDKKHTIEKRKNGKGLSKLWSNFKDEDWKKYVYFTNDEDIYIKAKDVGSALFFKRGFVLYEKDEDAYNRAKSLKPDDNFHISIDSMKYVLTILKGIGITEVDIKTEHHNVVTINTKRIEILIIPIDDTKPEPKSKDEPKSETKSHDENKNPRNKLVKDSIEDMDLDDEDDTEG